MTLARNRQINPTQPYLFLHGVDDEVVTSVPAALIWGHIDFKTSELHYAEGDDRVTINRHGAGIYEIIVSLCVEKKTANPGHSTVELYVNGIALDCAITHGFMGGAEQHSNAIMIYTVYLDVGDYVQTFVSVNNGSGQIEPSTGRFLMKGIAMKGWDNKRGGNTKYPFRQG